MKAIRVEKAGGPEVMKVADLPVPDPGRGEVRIRVEAIGVNFIDTYQRSGLYPMKLPYIPGQEGAGTVEALGPRASGFEVGDRVAWTGIPGSYAEQITGPCDHLVKIPSGIEAKQAAAVMLQGMTAHYLSTSTYALRPGDICLVHAAAGGVGRLLCQMAAARGAQVLATVSNEEKARIAADSGASEVIRYDRDDFEEEVRKLTEERGVQVVYDSVGRNTFEKGLRCLAPRGMMVLFGQSSGPVGPFDPQVLARNGSLFLTRPVLGHYIATHEDLLARATEVLGRVRDGTLRLRIGLELPLEKAEEAHRKLEGRETTGKVVLLP